MHVNNFYILIINEKVLVFFIASENYYKNYCENESSLNKKKGVKFLAYNNFIFFDEKLLQIRLKMIIE